MSQPHDHAARARAADPKVSCLVRAPAGSGKTSLLVLRYLNLLQHSNRPEEVLCITFTNKATEEMHMRILRALQDAENPEEAPENSVAAAERESARRVLKQSQRQSWDILTYPHRLNIRTLDSLSADIVRSLPVSQLLRDAGQNLLAQGYRLITQPEETYSRCVVKTLNEAEPDPQAEDGMKLLHRACGSNMETLHSELVNLLKIRNNWLPALATIQSEADLQISRNMLANFWQERFEEEIKQLGMATAWASYLAESNADPQTAICELREFLFTKAGDLRKRAVVESPAVDLMAEKLAPKSDAKIRHLLEIIERQLECVDADLSWCLPVRAFMLKLVARLAVDMASEGTADYSAIALAANAALESEQGVTDLALALDYRYRHILVDEAQDLSPMQLNLLESLVAGWESGDGRTLMLVGDILQSCYGFRSARPGLLGRVAQQGLGPVTLESLSLSENFRSRTEVVDFVNQMFSGVFPETPDINFGLAPYIEMQSQPQQGDSIPARIETTLWDMRDLISRKRGENIEIPVAKVVQAQECINFVQQALQELPNESRRGAPTDESSIAILVRKRSDLADIVRKLDAARIPYSADDTLPYKHSQCVRTLMALARVLRNPLDRIAHLALLRSPLCGLSMQEIHSLAADKYGDAQITSLREAFTQSERLQALSERSHEVVKLLDGLLQRDEGMVQRLSLGERLQTCWKDLQGQGVFATDASLTRTALAEIASWDDASDWNQRAEQFLNSKFLAGTPGQRVRLMTIHQSKGLQFGAVFIPAIHAYGQRYSAGLLEADFWYQDKHIYSLAGVRGEPLFSEYLTFLIKRREHLEAGRLLYIGMTRAIHQLGMSGIYQYKTAPVAGSMHAALSNSKTLQKRFVLPPKEFWRKLDQEEQTTPKPRPSLWSAKPRAAATFTEPDSPADNSGFIDTTGMLAGINARATGTLVHLFMDAVVHQGTAFWQKQIKKYPQRWEQFCRARLSTGMVPQASLDSVIGNTLECLQSALDDEKNHWIFAQKTADDALSGSELELGVRDTSGELVKNLRTDRSLMDGEGNRWVIDYKVAAQRKGESEQDFIQRQSETYHAQLMGYREIFLKAEPNVPVRCGLYFPQYQLFAEVE